MAKLIYVADDEQDILDVVKEFLVNAGYEVRTFLSGDDLFAAFSERPCDLVVLDVMMPGRNGLEICHMLRDISTVPIVILTAKDSEMDYARGFMQGGDDYMTKPFSPTLLVLKINALLRRVSMSDPEPVRNEDRILGDLSLSERKHAVFYRDTDLHLTNTEYTLLLCLAQNPGEALSRDALLEKVWGADFVDIETRVTDETVRRIRRKLSNAGSSVRITAVWGFGYKLEV